MSENILPHEIKKALFESLRHELSSWETKHAALERKTVYEIEELKKKITEELATEKENLLYGRYRESLEKGIEFGKSLGLKLDPVNDFNAVKRFIHEATKFKVHYLQIVIDRLQGDFFSERKVLKDISEDIDLLETRNKDFQNRLSDEIKVKHRLADVVQLYLNRIAPEKSPRTMKEYVNHSNLLLRTVGRNYFLEDFSHENAREFIDILMKLPRNMNKIKKFENKEINEIISIQNNKKISQRTVSNYMINLTTMFNWFVSQGYIENNVFSNKLAVKSKRQKGVQEPFSKEDLQKIFSAKYLFRTNSYDFRCWIPLIGYFTGMRVNEAAQLRRNNILEIDKIWCFKLEDKFDDQSLKTDTAKRIVPIHDFLVALGFLSYIDSVAQHEEDRIFPELPYINNSYGHNVSKWFGPFVRGLGITPQNDINKKTFHAFRATFTTMAKFSKISERHLHEFIGHKDRDLSYSYYADSYKAEQLKAEVLERMNFRIIPQNLLSSKYFLKFMIK